MSWLVIEDSKSGTVNLYNLNNVSAIHLDTELGEDLIKIWTVDDPNQPWEEGIDGLEEFEKLINTLPIAKDLGWIYIRDGKVRSWKGRLKLLSEEGGE
ncbi:hypothetical protein [Thermococcus sp.]|uniref:hypothetical protein n=1 Tax=Thermococcus sp. TaxID=35749 RepID=UPI002625E4B1|nr:hypothetical protein [Thermococcus sp.]